MNTPSPLVPQGAIPPKNTSRSARVLLIGATVVALHVAGLGVILMQGCQRDATKSAATGDTNSTALSLPSIDTNPPAYYTSATSLPTNAPVVAVNTNPPTVAAAPQTNVAIAPEPANTLPVITAETPVASTTPEKDYKIAKGDTLSKIAAQNRVSLTALLASNPNLDPKRLKIGQSIKVPTSASPTGTNGGGGSVGNGAPTVTASAAGTYKVKAGDNLTRIARAHGVSLADLKAANNLRTTGLVAGKVLKIPARRTAANNNGTTNQ